MHAEGGHKHTGARALPSIVEIGMHAQGTQKHPGAKATPGMGEI